MKHIFYECKSDNYKSLLHSEDGCMFCDGGLGLCIICHGFEAELTKDCCCGFKLNSEILDEIASEGLNYENKKWFYITPKLLQSTKGRESAEREGGK